MPLPWRDAACGVKDQGPLGAGCREHVASHALHIPPTLGPFSFPGAADLNLRACISALGRRAVPIVVVREPTQITPHHSYV